MAEQRGGEASLHLTEADESIPKIDHSGGDGGDGLFTPEYFKQLNIGRKTYQTFDLGAADPTPAVSLPIVQMANNLIDGDDDGGIETSTVLDYQGPFWEDNFYNQFSDLNFEKVNIDDDVKREDTNGLLDGERGMRLEKQSSVSEIISFPQNPTLPRRIRLIDTRNRQDFGRDTNRLDYFRVTAFDVYENDHLAGIANHGGGTRNRGVVVDPSTEAEIGGIRIRHGPVRLSADNGNEVVVPRLEERVDSPTAGADGGDRTRDVPVKRLKNEGSTVAMPVAVVVAVPVMVMLWWCWYR